MDTYRYTNLLSTDPSYWTWAKGLVYFKSSCLNSPRNQLPVFHFLASPPNLPLSQKYFLKLFFKEGVERRTSHPHLSDSRHTKASSLGERKLPLESCLLVYLQRVKIRRRGPHLNEKCNKHSLKSMTLPSARLSASSLAFWPISLSEPTQRVILDPPCSVHSIDCLRPWIYLILKATFITRASTA